MHSATERAPTPAGSNCCTTVEHAADARGVRLHLARDRGRDRFERLGEVAVVVDGVHDGAADRERIRRQVGELELPGQVVLQGPAGLVGELELAVAAARPGRLGFGRARLRPFVADLDHRLGFAVVALRVRASRPAAASADQVASKSSSASSMTFVSSASSTCACSSMVGSCSRRIACCSCGVIVSCWPIRSCRLGFIMRRTPLRQSRKSCPK